MEQNNSIKKTMIYNPTNWLSIIGLGGCGCNIVEDLHLEDSNRIGIYKFDAEHKEQPNSIETIFGDLTILIAGLGGKYGANKLVDLIDNKTAECKSVFALVVMPYTFEGKERRRKAFETLKSIEENNSEVSIVPFDNDSLSLIYANSNLADMNRPISSIIRGLTNLLLKQDHLTTDYDRKIYENS